MAKKAAIHLSTLQKLRLLGLFPPHFLERLPQSKTRQYFPLNPPFNLPDFRRFLPSNLQINNRQHRFSRHELSRHLLPNPAIHLPKIHIRHADQHKTVALLLHLSLG